MPEETVSVGSTVGLHARPAAAIADVAVTFSAPITLHLVGEEDEGADAASSLMIMSLGAQCGDEVRVVSSDPAAVKAIAALISSNLDDAL